MPITKRDVDATEPGTVLWDTGRGSVSGFGLRCQKRARVFILKYSVGGRGRWYTIGKFGAPWTVDTARKEAQRLLGEIASGNDPAATKQKEKLAAAPVLVAELCDRYLEAAQAGLVLTRFNRPKKNSTLEIDIGRIERHIKPLLGKLPVKDVNSMVVRRMIADITAGKTARSIKTRPRGRARVTGGPGAAARVTDLLSGIMSWAVEEDIIDQNPVHGVKRYRGQPRQRYLSFDELRRLGETLRSFDENEGKGFHPFATRIVELLCMSGCRLGEIAGLRWKEIDFQDGCLRLADTKTGQSMRAVGKPVIERLSVWPRTSGSDFVFPAYRGTGHYTNTKSEIRKILAACDIDNASCHTLRHTYASVASELGYSDGTIAGLLGHAGRSVTSRYIHRPDAALKSAADEIACNIDSALMGRLEREVTQTMTNRKANLQKLRSQTYGSAGANDSEVRFSIDT